MGDDRGGWKGSGWSRLWWGDGRRCLCFRVGDRRINGCDCMVGVYAMFFAWLVVLVEDDDHFLGRELNKLAEMAQVSAMEAVDPRSWL